MDLTTAEIEQRLQAFYTTHQDGHGPYQVSETVLLDSGFEADIFAFVLHSASQEPKSQNLVLRVYAGGGASEKAKREFDAMLRLHESGYPVPHVHVLQPEQEPLGRPFMVMEKIHGIQLESAYWQAPGNERQDLKLLHYRLMAQLHSLDGPALIPNSLLSNADGFLDHEISTLSVQVQALGIHAPASLREALAWLDARRSSVICERLVAIHGDFHRNNILLCPHGSAFVIDWSNVRLADYRADLAWALLISRLIARGSGMSDGIEHERRMYEQQSGKTVVEIEYFEVIACLRLLLSVLLSLQFGSAGQGLQPEIEARMRKEADASRYIALLLQERTSLKMPDLEDALSDLIE